MNITHQIVNTLEAKGYSKDYIIGFLQGTLQGIAMADTKPINMYMEHTLKQVQDMEQA